MYDTDSTDEKNSDPVLYGPKVQYQSRHSEILALPSAEPERLRAQRPG